MPASRRAASDPPPGSSAAPWWHTALLLAAVVVAAAEASVPGDGTPLGARLIVWACAVASIPGVLWRRERPWVLPVAGVVAAAAGPTTLLVLGLFSYALRRRDRTTVLLAALGALALATPWSMANAGTVQWSTDQAVLEPTDAVRMALSWLTRVAFVCGGSLALGGYLGARRDLMASLRERAARAESERELRAGQAVLRERERLSREMHDVLGHKLTLLAMQAGALEVSAPTDQVRADAELLRTTARDAMADLRAVVHGLDSPSGADLPGVGPASGDHGAPAAPDPPDNLAVPLHPQATLTDVGALVAASRGSGAAVTLHDGIAAAAHAAPPAGTVGRAGFRVVQEGLTNAHRHAPGLGVEVSLTGAPGTGLTVEVRNPLPLAAHRCGDASGGGTGLRGLAERVRLAGGTLTAGPQGPDFVVVARLPWGTSDQGATTP